jgi:AsmA protein
LTTPGGPVTGEVAVNAAAATPTLRLALRAPALQLAPLQQALAGTVYVTGRAELDADLRGAGAGLRQVAASLGGHLGLAMLDATMEPALLGPVQQALRARVPLLPPLPQRLPVECVALRADVAEGIARIGTLLLDAPAAKVSGSGTVNLGTEAIALRMLHDVRAAGTSTRVAADLGGTLAAPAYGGVQVQNLVGQAAGALAGRLGGDAGALLGALANRPGAQPEPLPDCGPALTAARGGREGAMPARAEPEPQPQPEAAAPAAPAAPAQPQQPAAPAIPGPAGDLLRGLLRR